jgi:hypothetical protein
MLEVNRRELAHLQAPNEEEALEGQLELAATFALWNTNRASIVRSTTFKKELSCCSKIL